MKQHNKLVRDRIPQILNDRGVQFEMPEVSGARRYEALIEKLREEVEEFASDGTMEELADVLEVVHALSEAIGISVDELEKTRNKKRADRGGFEAGVLLISTNR